MGWEKTEMVESKSKSAQSFEIAKTNIEQALRGNYSRQQYLIAVTSPAANRVVATIDTTVNVLVVSA